ncbi:endonuclease domain-containing protein [Nonomuraea sp. CA-141351]|uniref:endonuclease domain-containing protein n=1 Tax=Nonomuraea sp. CA-141351 TaxID=3239996 RepID=UPI003D94AECA
MSGRGVRGVAWSELPIGRVVRLDGDADAIALAVDPLPPGAPAIVTYFTAEPRSTSEMAASVLRELDKAALALFPAWLPGAEGIEGPGGAHLPAVRALALRKASAGEHFGPFLAELAERALAGGESAFPPEVRMAGLVRVLADSFGRARAAILVRVPDGLGAVAEEVLVGTCEWMAHRGAAGVWLTGAPLKAVDRVETMPLDVPGVAKLGMAPDPGGVTEPGVAGERGLTGPATASSPPAVGYPAVAGRPHPGSPSEQALEVALATREWASGRAWNQTYQPHPLAVPIRLDLLWEKERCVVEIDGPEHRGAAKFADDRQRDVRLQLDGYAVLRFPDVQVLTDIETVIRQIGQFLRGRRGTKG